MKTSILLSAIAALSCGVPQTAPLATSFREVYRIPQTRSRGAGRRPNPSRKHGRKGAGK